MPRERNGPQGDKQGDKSFGYSVVVVIFPNEFKVI